ncbi:MAG TPA: hypothetical protein VFD58_14850 [Blastocatellia bacterium]|nr:hypothetical protein [Blastocatellia bacterium]
MSAREIQSLLSRLYTDETLLAWFLADREGFCRDYAGGGGDFIAQINERQLQYFADQLRWKRLREARKLIPLTRAALGHGFDREFQRYASTCVSGGERKHLADAMAFCEFLLGDETERDRLTLEAAEYELLSFNLRFRLRREGSGPVVCRAELRRGPLFRLKLFTHEVPALTVEMISARAPRNRTTPALFVSLFGRRDIWYW